MSVLVYTENWDGKFKKLSFELISYAKELSKKLNTELVALSIGAVEESELQKLAVYGADKIIKVNNPILSFFDAQIYNSIIAQLAEKMNSKVILFSHNNTGKELSSRLSVRLKAGLVSAVIAQPYLSDGFIVRKKVFTSKAFASVKINSEIKILSLLQNAYGLFEDPKQAVVEEFNIDIDLSAQKYKVLDVNKVTGKIILTDADIVVSGGRGMKGPENWGPIEELATLLGAATACSRPVADEHWRPHEEHVGQTGKILSPSLYIACGISGAIQHLGGISNSKYIVAINKDPEAPIFEAADYGIVGDVSKILPDLINAVKEFKA